MFKCEVCGKEFETDWRKAKRDRNSSPRFCSQNCLNKYKLSLTDKTKKKDAKCNRCSKDIKINICQSVHRCLCEDCRKEKSREKSRNHYMKNKETYKLYRKFKSFKNNIMFGTKICLNCGKSYNLNNKRFCCKECEKQYREKQFIESLTNRIENMKMREASVRRKVRKYLIQKYGNKCAICGTETWNNLPIPLICDHINGDPSDNRLENFRLICPNCDAQLSTYVGRNKGHGRKSKNMSR